MILTDNEVFNLNGNTLYQLQVAITSGNVQLQVSQDGLPYTAAKTYTEDTVELLHSSNANYKVVYSGVAQASVIPVKFKA